MAKKRSGSKRRAGVSGLSNTLTLGVKFAEIDKDKKLSAKQRKYLKKYYTLKQAGLV